MPDQRGWVAAPVDHEVDGDDGEASLVKLFNGEVPDTMGWSSRRGPHRLFAHDPRLIGAQGQQLQSACPPTLGEDGEPRRWNDFDTIAN